MAEFKSDEWMGEPMSWEGFHLVHKSCQAIPATETYVKLNNMRDVTPAWSGHW